MKIDCGGKCIGQKILVLKKMRKKVGDKKVKFLFKVGEKVRNKSFEISFSMGV